MNEEEKSNDKRYPAYREKKEVPEYVMELYKNLVAQETERGFVFCKIIGTSKYGFLIKSNGLYGTLPIKMMPWRYRTWKVWHQLEESFIGVIFRCTIMDNTLPLLYFDARETKFTRVILEKGQEVKARVVNTSKTGFFFEFGHHFKWKYGSLIGRMNKKDYPYISVWGDKSIGTELTVYYNETSEKGHMLFFPSPYSELGLNWESFVWHKRIVHPITVLFQENGKRTYWVYGKFPALIHKKRYKGKVTPTVEQKAFLNSLENGDVFDCRIIEITKSQSHFIVVLAMEL